MKKALLVFLCALAFLLASCNEVLSVVTADKDGKKTVTNYILMVGDTIYDETISFDSWKKIEPLEKDINELLENPLFKVENKKRQNRRFGKQRRSD